MKEILEINNQQLLHHANSAMMVRCYNRED